MRMRKLFVEFLAVVMLFSVLPMASFAADKTAKIMVDSVVAKPGDTVSISVTLENNPGIVSANIHVAFDEGLTLIGATNGNTFPKSMSFIPPKQLSTVGKITGNCNFAWQGVDIADEDIKDGVILTLSFKVSENAKAGDGYKITITSRRSDIVDNNLQCVDLNISQGEVSISNCVFDSDNANTFSRLIEIYIYRMRRVFELIKQLILKQINQI